MLEKERAIRPYYYLAIDELAKSPSARESMIEKDRALALEAVIAHAPEMGMDKALKKFGDSLLPTEHKLLAMLTKEEITALKSIRSKVGSLFGIRSVMINIYEK